MRMNKSIALIFLATAFPTLGFAFTYTEESYYDNLSMSTPFSCQSLARSSHGIRLSVSCFDKEGDAIAGKLLKGPFNCIKGQVEALPASFENSAYRGFLASEGVSRVSVKFSDLSRYTEKEMETKKSDHGPRLQIVKIIEKMDYKDQTWKLSSIEAVSPSTLSDFKKHGQNWGIEYENASTTVSRSEVKVKIPSDFFSADVEVPCIYKSKATSCVFARGKNLAAVQIQRPIFRARYERQLTLELEYSRDSKCNGSLAEDLKDAYFHWTNKKKESSAPAEQIEEYNQAVGQVIYLLQAEGN
ncbi:MAG: hypothetical protein AABZ55_05135 [Bdellovibrionota bacterium]